MEEVRQWHGHGKRSIRESLKNCVGIRAHNRKFVGGLVSQIKRSMRGVNERIT